ncbi:MAG TPA: VIT domain-containing protein [Xanthomonadales bacterium]|nr:VIT domain-containing protein [Xanthomonadales bacterium]
MNRLILLLALALPTLAAALSPPLPPPPPPPPQVWIAPGSGLQPIRLADVDIQIRTRGFIARTTLDLRFDNPNARVLEGEFVFPLAAGQTVAGYALEVNGAMREGVVVDKETARVAFEETSRRQIDPGLAELTAGNVFRTRLYPIPANGSKRVRLHLESTLADHGDSWRYLLPLQFKDPVGRLHIRAETTLSDSAPLGDDLKVDADLKFDRRESAWIAEFTRENVRPRSELAFRIPKSGDRAQVEAADVLDPAWRSVIALTDSGRPDGAKPNKPRRVAVFVDASASARDRDRQREAAVLSAWFKALGNVQVRLVAFRNDADPALRFDVRDGDASKLLDAIAALPLDGGSSYGAIQLSAVGDVDQVLIIGDGLSNFGDSEPDLVAANGQRPGVQVMHAAQRADHARLARIARAGGGSVLDLATQLDAQAAAQQLLQRNWRLLSVDSKGGQCREISPQAPSPVNFKLTLTARCRGRGELLLRFGYGDDASVERIVSFGQQELAPAALADSVHRLWAQAWLAELASATQPDSAAMIAIGKRYGVVTQGTSLLVLDRIEDYVRYRVEPKEAPLLAEYRRLIEAQPKIATDPGRDARMQSLLQRWREFRDYHAASYPGIESLLLPLVQAEASSWPSSGDKARVAGYQEAQALAKKAEELVARWLRDGAEPDSRATWEREAARVVLAVEALRERRAQLPQIAGPDLDQARSEAAGAMADAVTVGESAPEAELARDDMPRPSAPPPPPAAAPASMAAPGQAIAERREGAGAEESKLAAKPDDGSAAVAATAAQIELSGWNPDTPYLDDIRDAADPYLAYLDQREVHGTTPAFYLDVADFLRDQAKSPRLALRVLSNLAELDSENTALTRVLAYRLSQWNLHALAVPQFEYALAQRPEEPQSYRDLGLALARQTQPDRARAVEMLWQVAIGEWHGRFPDIEIIALHELNDVLAQAPVGTPIDLEKVGIPAELLDPVAVGLRVVLSWDADNTDIDLWVVDPAGDKAVYSQPRTRTGGHMSRDFTGGYGPEVFTIRRPLPGTYVVLANYFGDRRQSLTGPVTIQLEFQTRFGTATSERASTTRRLESGSQTIEIGKFKVGAP